MRMIIVMLIHTIILADETSVEVEGGWNLLRNTGLHQILCKCN